jgi:hypothetical protein
LAQISPMRSRSSALSAGEGFFPDLLVAALQRAVALAEMDRVALAVAETWISMWRGFSRYFSM